MSPARRSVVTLALSALLVLSGCAGLFGSDAPAGNGTESPVTPAPVPEDAGRTTPPADRATATPSTLDAGPNGRALAGASAPRNYWAGISADPNQTAVTQPRYLAAHPTCERPPGAVIHLQVAALGNNDPTTDEGINATWRFLAPSFRQSFGTYTAFADVVIVQYRSLLTAEAVAYGALERDGDVASQRVTVLGPDRTTTTYEWRVANQTEEPYEGCWMTTDLDLVSDR